MGEEVFRIVGRRGKGLHLADRGVDAFFFRRDGVDGFLPKFLPYLDTGFRKPLFDREICLISQLF